MDQWLEGGLSAVGDPAYDLFFPGDPVPRPEGRPFALSEAREADLRQRLDSITLTAKQRRKIKSSISQGRKWRRLENYRTTVRLVLLEQVPGHQTIQEPILAVMEFFRERPKKKTGDLVTVRPDAKNLIWALEDALNPRFKLVSRKRIKTWPGFWEDDALVTPVGVRRFAKNRREVGSRLRVWPLTG